MQPGEITSVGFYGNQKFAIGKVMQGGMGTVYQLVPIAGSAPPVALKTFQDVMSARDFERECKAWLSVIGHRNVARALAYGQWEGASAILVDWYPELMASLNVGTLKDEAIVKLVRGLVSALDFAYSSVGLIHQDIKPANILVDADGNARLSDFGLARCVAPRVGSTLSTWANTTTLLPTKNSAGGTPFYMALELLVGRAQPSVKTDLFSLGVTLFQFLTGEHPYFGPENKNREVPRLRATQLMDVLSRRGPSLKPLEELIIQCLSLDPDDRPSSYRATGWAEASEPSNLEVRSEVSRITAVVTRAQYLRERGDYRGAEKILQDELRVSPKQPILLNALGVLAEKRGRKEEAIFVLDAAFKELKRTSGKVHGVVYLDPAINLAGRLLAVQHFDQAYSVLRTSWQWAQSQASDLSAWQPFPRADKWYPEFGWMLLYAGEFERAATYMAELMSNRGPDKILAYWLLEAAWLGKRLETYANDLVRALTPFVVTDAAAALGGCLAGQFANPNLLRTLLAELPWERRKEIQATEREAGLSQDGLLMPRTLEAQKMIVRSIDHLVTGGKHNGLVG